MKKYLKLDDFFITKLNVNWTSNVQDIEENPFIDYEILRNPENNREFGMRLLVQTQTKSDPGKPRLHIEAEISGFFTFFEDVDENKKQVIIRINGATILYGILRGVITSTSGSFPCGHFVLPSVYMNEILPKIDSRKKKSLPKKSGNKPGAKARKKTSAKTKKVK